MYTAQAFRACKLHHLRRRWPLDAGCAILGAGPVGKGWARLLQAQAIPVSAFVEVHPRRIGRVIQGVPVVDYPRVSQLGPITILAAVGRAGVRQQIQAHFEAHPLAPGQRLVFLA